jgi:hypothetical protein
VEEVVELDDTEVDALGAMLKLVELDGSELEVLELDYPEVGAPGAMLKLVLDGSELRASKGVLLLMLMTFKVKTVKTEKRRIQDKLWVGTVWGDEFLRGESFSHFLWHRRSTTMGVKRSLSWVIIPIETFGGMMACINAAI